MERLKIFKTRYLLTSVPMFQYIYVIVLIRSSVVRGLYRRICICLSHPKNVEHWNVLCKSFPRLTLSSSDRRARPPNRSTFWNIWPFCRRKCTPTAEPVSFHLSKWCLATGSPCEFGYGGAFGSFPEDDSRGAPLGRSPQIYHHITQKLG